MEDLIDSVDATWTPDAQDVQFFTSPWIDGTRAAAYFGPAQVVVFLADADYISRPFALEKLVSEALSQLRDKALFVGANAMVGLDPTLDPFAIQNGVPGMSLHICGTLAKLERF